MFEGNYKINELDNCDIKFLLELWSEDTGEQVIEFADGIDWL